MVQVRLYVRTDLTGKFVQRELVNEFVERSLVAETVRPFRERELAGQLMVDGNAELKEGTQFVVRCRTRRTSVMTYQDSVARPFRAEMSAETSHTLSRNVVTRLSTRQSTTRA